MPPETAAQAAVAELLRLKAPLSVPVLRAALKGRRVQLGEDELVALLRGGAFAEGPAGQWSLARAVTAPGPASAPAPAPVPAERFTREQLAARCGVTTGVLGETLAGLVGDDSGVDWAALSARLAAGASVAVSARTVGLLEAGVRRTQAVRAREADKRRREMAESEVAMLRSELDDERRRAATAATERDRLREHATRLVSQQSPEAPSWQTTDAGGRLLDLGAPETFGEERLRAVLAQLESAVVVLDVHLGEREIEAVVVHPGGVAVVEQYDVAATAGVVEVPASGPAMLEETALVEDPRAEVMGSVRAVQGAVGLDVAYLPVVCFQGPSDASAEDVLACLTSELDLAIEDILQDRPPVSAELVVALLEKLGVPALPQVPDGF